MTGAFRMESRLFRIVEKTVNLIKLNIIWVLCSLPIVTGGAALCALHVTAVKILKDEEGYVKRGWEPCGRYAGAGLCFGGNVGFACHLYISACGQNGYGGRGNIPQWGLAVVQISASVCVSIVYYGYFCDRRTSMDPGVLCGTVCRRSAACRGPREDVDVDLRERKDLSLIPSGSTVSLKVSDIQYFLRDIFPGVKHLLHLRSPFSVKI